MLKFLFDIETIAVIFGFICVYLTVKENIWCWPTGIVNINCFIILFYNNRLYGQVFLQVVFFILSIYGWHQWLHGGKNGGRLEVSRLDTRQILFYLGFTVVFTLMAGFGLHYFAGEEVGYLDAFITGLSLVAQYLMARKKLECWIGWITVDVLSIGMFAYKGLYKTSLLYVAFLILATKGFFEWKKNYRPEPV